MELLGDVALVESHSVHSETVLVSEQDRCTVCAQYTIGLEIILDAPVGTPMYEVQGEAHFIPFGDSANHDVRCTVCTECTMGSEIVLDAPDGTPRRRGSCGILFWSTWRWS
jgi:hypothetical protein